MPLRLIQLHLPRHRVKIDALPRLLPRVYAFRQLILANRRVEPYLALLFLVGSRDVESVCVVDVWGGRETKAKVTHEVVSYVDSSDSLRSQD